MKTYNISIVYQCIETISVEAENLEQAMIKSGKEFLSIPDEKYLCDSFEFDFEGIEEDYPNEEFNIASIYNNI